MNNEVIQNTENNKIIKYNGFKNKNLYFFYLYDMDKYETYKRHILKKGFTIIKIHFTDKYVKFFYKNYFLGYTYPNRIKYFKEKGRK